MLRLCVHGGGDAVASRPGRGDAEDSLQKTDADRTCSGVYTVQEREGGGEREGDAITFRVRA